MSARAPRARMVLGAEKVLTREFYARPVLTVARESIGKFLVSRTRDGEVIGRVVEAEAYRGPEDRAAHSHRGLRTARTEVMFGEAGHAYVFLVYGMHWHFNIVTGGIGEPHAVLVRAVEPVAGHALMAKRRGLPEGSVGLTNGPGKLCKAFGIDRARYGADVTRADLHLLDGPRVRVRRSPRIGIDYAGAWAEMPWRFYDATSPYVSGTRRGI